ELPADGWVDVLAAGDAARAAESLLGASELAGAVEAATLAASLLREPFMSAETAAWVESKRRELEQIRSRALLVLSEATLRSGQAEAAAAWAEQAIQAEPFRDIGYRLLMEANAASGNRAEALRVYERCRRLLAEELGAFPSPETEAVYRRLLEEAVVE